MDQRSDSDAALRESGRRQERLAELGQVALETSDTDELLHHAAEAAADSLEAAYVAVFERRAADELLLREGWAGGRTRSERRRSPRTRTRGCGACLPRRSRLWRTWKGRPSRTCSRATTPWVASAWSSDPSRTRGVC